MKGQLKLDFHQGLYTVGTLAPEATKRGSTKMGKLNKYDQAFQVFTSANHFFKFSIYTRVFMPSRRYNSRALGEIVSSITRRSYWRGILVAGTEIPRRLYNSARKDEQRKLRGS